MNTEDYMKLVHGIKIFLHIFALALFWTLLSEIIVGAIVLSMFVMLIVFNFRFEHVLALWGNIFRGYTRTIDRLAFWLAGFIRGMKEEQ